MGGQQSIRREEITSAYTNKRYCPNTVKKQIRFEIKELYLNVCLRWLLLNLLAVMLTQIRFHTF
jgi:hypothetical protein